MIVVKIGGSKGISYEPLAEDIAAIDYKIVLIHGGNVETTKICGKLGIEPRFLTSLSGYTSRYTDRETMDVFSMVYAGKIQTNMVALLHKYGKKAVGLSGVDAGILRAKRKDTIVFTEGGKKKVLHGDYTGKIVSVNSGFLELLLEKGYLPVISPIALSEENEPLNVDGDVVAAWVAQELKANDLVILSNVPGLLKDKNDESTLIKRIDKSKLEEFAEFAKGRMKKKVLGAKEALEKGVKRVIFADARKEKPLSSALLGKGTVIE